MARNIVTKSRAKSALNVDMAVVLNQPIDLMNKRLDRAHATLDIMYSMVVQTDRIQEILESLSAGTLIRLIQGLVGDVELARDIAREMANGKSGHSAALGLNS